MNKKGFSKIIFLVTIVLIGIAGYFVLVKKQEPVAQQIDISSSISNADLQTYRNDKYGFELGYSSKLKPYIVEADGKNFTSNKTSPCLLLGDFYEKSEIEVNKNTDNYTQSYLSLCLLDDQMIFGQGNPNRILEDYAKTRYAPTLHNQFTPTLLKDGIKALELNTSRFRVIYIRLKSGKVLEVINQELLKGTDVIEIIKSTITTF